MLPARLASLAADRLLELGLKLERLTSGHLSPHSACSRSSARSRAFQLDGDCELLADGTENCSDELVRRINRLADELRP